jgi:dihydrolipoamide dehydrogenase
MKIIIIGAGPAGYTAAFKARQEGHEVILFTKDHTGGVCLNEGCIPTKSLLEDAHHLHQSHHFDANIQAIQSVSAVYGHKDMVQAELKSQLERSLTQAKVQLIHRAVHFSDNHHVIDSEGNTYDADVFIIATGARAQRFYPHDAILESRDVLNKPFLATQRIALIGAGVIGVEIASFLAMMGHSVHLFDIAPRCVMQAPKELSQSLERELKAYGIQIHTNTHITSIDHTDYFTIHTEKESFEFDQCIEATGRVGNFQDLGLENTDVQTTLKTIVGNDRYQTTVPNIYAIGDVSGAAQLAHVASDLGEQVIDLITHHKAIQQKTIPYVIYTPMAAAYAGISEEQAKQMNLTVQVKKVLISGLAKQKIKINRRAYLKMIIDEHYHLIGVEILSSDASELINTCILVMDMHVDMREIPKRIYAHPSMGEIFKEVRVESF